MAGGFKGQFDPKNKQFKQVANSEVWKDDSHISSADKKPVLAPSFSLKGILGLGQTIEIHKSPSASKESFFGLNHLAQEQNILFDQRQKEIKKAIEDLRAEITKLIHSSENLNKDIQKIAVEEFIDTNEYQLTVLARIRIFLSGVNKNISEAKLWVDAFAVKKKKKNMFWNKVKNKKQGGDQYLFSNEHSAARSVN